LTTKHNVTGPRGGHKIYNNNNNMCLKLDNKMLRVSLDNNKIIYFTKKVMSYFKTSMRLHTEGKIIETEDLEIKRKIFKGDSLQPWLFCIIIFPLNEQLIKLKSGYQEQTTKRKVSHLLYKDYLKMIYKTEEELQTQMQAVRTISDDIHMEFGLDKRKRLVLQRGKLFYSQNLIFNFNRRTHKSSNREKHTST
jgi:hypothetical protein